MIAEAKAPAVRTVDMTLIAEADEVIGRMPLVDCRSAVVRFTPGLCTRELDMFPGNIYRSKIHKTHHQAIMSLGSCLVKSNGGPWVLHVSPWHGETMPGTWRLIFPLSHTRWTTMHATDLTTADEVESDITEDIPK